MRIIGLDLSLTSAHKAVVMDGNGKFLTPVIKVATWPDELNALLCRARQDVDPGESLLVVMEPTGHAWLPVAAFLLQQANVTVYVVNSQQVADLRRFYKKHAKSDRIDARVLAKLPLVSMEKLHPLRLPSADTLALQRACKQLDWLTGQITALKNQIIAIDRTVWLGSWQPLVFPDPFGHAARWCRDHYYDPVAVVRAGTETIRQQWQKSPLASIDSSTWVEDLVNLATEVLAVYGRPSPFVHFDAWCDEIRLKQQWLNHFEQDLERIRAIEVRARYRRLHPSRNLETIKGIGQDSAAVFFSFAGDPSRFANNRLFRGWSGMVPASSQSVGREGKGLRISQAGPSLVKKYAFLNADVARQWDPQLAKIYYDQMVHKGKHHTQAVCAVATHLLDRILVILKEDRPYELRDVDGMPVTVKQAKRIITEKYTVPREVRRRNSRRGRQQRAERRAEQTYAQQRKREGRPTI